MSNRMGQRAYADIRREGRDDVHYRARAFGPDARELRLLIVNVSRHGMMVRCAHGFELGDRIRVSLPIVGVLVAEVRWSLGGRLGCQFETTLDPTSYYELLTMLIDAK